MRKAEFAVAPKRAAIGDDPGAFQHVAGAIGLPGIAHIVGAGVTVFAGSDNVRDAWQPYGTGDMLERAWIVAYRSAFRRDSEFRFAHQMVSSLGAKACGFASHGLAVGDDADFVVLAAENIADAICRRPPRRCVMRRGRIVARDGRYLGPTRSMAAT